MREQEVMKIMFFNCFFEKSRGIEESALHIAKIENTTFSRKKSLICETLFSVFFFFLHISGLIRLIFEAI